MVGKRLDMKTMWTNDLGLAAALATMGHEIVMVDLSENGRISLGFWKTLKLQQSAVSYYDNSFNVDAKGYLENYNALKSQILNEY